MARQFHGFGELCEPNLTSFSWFSFINIVFRFFPFRVSYLPKGNRGSFPGTGTIQVAQPATGTGVWLESCPSISSYLSTSRAPKNLRNYSSGRALSALPNTCNRKIISRRERERFNHFQHGQRVGSMTPTVKTTATYQATRRADLVWRLRPALALALALAVPSLNSSTRAISTTTTNTQTSPYQLHAYGLNIYASLFTVCGYLGCPPGLPMVLWQRSR